ncbi:MAG: hypothetical protein QM650_13205 [Microlunatus sp.]
MNHEAITRVLIGSGSIDALGEREQAAVREAWTERMALLREGLNYGAEFAAAGESYSEADEDGKVVIHPGSWRLLLALAQDAHRHSVMAEVGATAAILTAMFGTSPATLRPAERW